VCIMITVGASIYCKATLIMTQAVSVNSFFIVVRAVDLDGENIRCSVGKTLWLTPYSRVPSYRKDS
jgi:hypothetical protein